MIIGRNFDFYFGDDFAKNKFIFFYEPERGHKFISVSWASMIGVLSGMNDHGLTITMNAAKGPLPISSATPISIFAREILQYASNIEEAFAIAKSRDSFVSESLLIGSDHEGCAAIIEKTPLKTVLYNSDQDYIVCANHFQSDELRNEPANLDNICNSDSQYRFDRIKELLTRGNIPVSPQIAADILRNRYGKQDADIGLTNEKAINQFIAHHSVIFQPAKRRMWVSVGPWQLGKYICYDLNAVFEKRQFDAELFEPELTISADNQLLAVDYPRVLEFRQLTKQFLSQIKDPLFVPDESSIVDYLELNPNFYYSYEVAGDMYKIINKDRALSYWKRALEKEIPTRTDRLRIEKKIKNN